MSGFVDALQDVVDVTFGQFPDGVHVRFTDCGGNPVPELSSPGTSLYLCFRGGRLAGYAQLSKCVPPAQLSVETHDRFRRQGVMTSLLARMMSTERIDPADQVFAGMNRAVFNGMLSAVDDEVFAEISRVQPMTCSWWGTHHGRLVCDCVGVGQGVELMGVAG